MNKIEGGGDAEKAMRSPNCHPMKMYVNSIGRTICRPFAPVLQTKFSRCLTKPHLKPSSRQPNLLSKLSFLRKMSRASKANGEIHISN